MFRDNIEHAVLEALAYSDIFDFPLRKDEVLNYLPVCVESDELGSAFESLRGVVDQRDGVYFLSGRDEIVEVRKRREARSQKLMPYAIRYGRILGALPFVRMVALTGSLAVMNVSTNEDFDYMLVVSKGRVWTARAFALLLNRFARILGHTLCPNLVISETALEWRQRDLYSARELCQMIPVTGVDVYRRLMKANEWVNEFLPNVIEVSEVSSSDVFLQKLFELPLRGKLGDKFEQWEMSRKIARFSKQAGFGEETIFTPEICQGNFHHHRNRTMELFEGKLMSIDSPLPAGEGLEVRA